MVVYILYLLFFLGLIYFTGFFGLFKDDAISNKKFTLLFLGKALAVPVFLYLYTKLYGGIDNLDTGKFYHDVNIIYAYGKTDFSFLFRLLLGLQDDNPNSADYQTVLKNTLNWDNGTTKDYLYNDNRVVIRLHVLLNFIAFGSYSAQALFSCFLSFTGIFFLYKTVKEWFKGKETWVLLILCFFPSLWFYTGALLKEGFTIFVLGCTLYQLKQLISGQLKWHVVPFLIFLLYVSMLLKPYLLCFSALFFSLFFIFYYSQKIKHKVILFFSSLVVLVIVVNIFSVIVKHRSLSEAIAIHQHRFIGVSRGGIFLSDGTNFIRLTNDTSQIKHIGGKENNYMIRKNASYMYWQTEDQKDTLYCRSNQDTSTLYKLEYIIQPGNSNVTLPSSSFFSIAASCFYYTLFYPTFYTAKNQIQLLASAENGVILIALLILIFGFLKNKKDKFLPFAFLVFALCLCLLIGLTAPNSGAIFRYRSPAIIFLLLAALYYISFPNFLIKRRL